MTFTDLQARYPDFCGDFSPDFGLPTRADFDRLEKAFGVVFPKSYVEFQTRYAARMRAVGDGFRWANAGLEPHLSLESLLGEAQGSGYLALGLLPFWKDGGDGLAFQLDGAPNPAEPPVAWFMRDGSTFPLADGFVPWLAACYEDLRRDLMSHFNL